MERCLWQEERHGAPRAQERERANPSFSATFLTFFERQKYPFIEHIASLQTHEVLFFYAKNSERDLNGHGMKCKNDPENRF